MNQSLPVSFSGASGTIQTNGTQELGTYMGCSLVNASTTATEVYIQDANGYVDVSYVAAGDSGFHWAGTDGVRTNGSIAFLTSPATSINGVVYIR